MLIKYVNKKMLLCKHCLVSNLYDFLSSVGHKRR